MKLNIISAKRDIAQQLATAGIENPPREAALLLAAALQVERAALLALDDISLSEAEAARLAEFIRRRANREPLARLVGHKEFWGLRFQLNPATLVPRPETETLVEVVLNNISDRAAPLRILDLGIGTGCILLALLSEYRQASGVGIDAVADAVMQAQANAAALGLGGRAAIQTGDWVKGLDEQFDVIVSNPPYVETTADLMAEVRDFDPAAALFAGADGLDAYRTLIPPALALLKPGGLLALEVGAGQADAVAALIQAVDPSLDPQFQPDLAGINRVVWATHALN